MSNQKPSNRPADDGNLTGVLKTAIRKEMQNMNVMLPAEVVSYDRATNRAVIKHLVQMQGSDGKIVSRAQLASIRTYQFGNGAFSMGLPIKPGDKGWIKAADRDISTFQQGLNESAPNTDRMHSFEDGLFMPDAMTQGAAPAGQDDAVVIGAVNGAAYIAFTGDRITLNVGGQVLELTADGLKHNGINIGDDHKHLDVTAGADTTGVPES